MCGETVTDGGSGREHDTYDCSVSLRAKLSAATARASELETALDAQHRLNLAFVVQNNVLVRRNQHLDESLTELVAKRDAELAAMGERVARTEAAAELLRRHHALRDENPYQFSLTRSLLRQETAAWCDSDQPETKGKTDERHDD